MQWHACVNPRGHTAGHSPPRRCLHGQGHGVTGRRRGGGAHLTGPAHAFLRHSPRKPWGRGCDWDRPGLALELLGVGPAAPESQALFKPSALSTWPPHLAALEPRVLSGPSPGGTSVDSHLCPGLTSAFPPPFSQQVLSQEIISVN